MTFIQSVGQYLREPTLHFLLIGALLFGIDHYFTLQRDDPRQIFVDKDKLAWLVETFQQGQGRLPEADEIDNLIIKWSQNEVFYREAQALGLDQGDEMMRSRLILKMRNILFNRLVEETPNDDELRTWFDLNRANYDVPTRYSFEQFPLADGDGADKAGALAASLLNTKPPAPQEEGLRQYPRRPARNIESLFSADGRKTLLDAPTGEWVAVQSTNTWHLARVIEVHAAIPAEFEQVRSQVVRDYRKVAHDLQLAEMASAVADKYQLHLDFEATDLNTILAEAENFAPQITTADSRTLKARRGVSKTDDGDEPEEG